MAPRTLALRPLLGEIIFVVTEDPERGFTARALGQAIFTEADDLGTLRERVRDASAATSTRAGLLGGYGSTSCATTSSPYDPASPRRHKREARLGALSTRLRRDPPNRQHMRLTTVERGERHVTVPRHDPLRIGTLGAIFSEVAAHFETSRDELLDRLFDEESLMAFRHDRE